jgi:hypothetical protein
MENKVKTFKVSAALLNMIVNYLSKMPYEEVHMLMKGLNNKDLVSPLEEKNNEPLLEVVEK